MRSAAASPGATPGPRGATKKGASGAPTGSLADGIAMKGQTVGAPRDFEGLAVFPIFGTTDPAVGPVTTLDRALAARTAEVRELGAQSHLRRGRAEPAVASDQVNKLVIENVGELPIYVLAGTVVKGGNQDRQIGQDFIIDPKQTVAVDAFCVEHGRWTAQRDGRRTGGQFGSSAKLVTSKVRAAAQYEKNQSEVWDSVARVNAAHHKSAGSGTLLATLDDPAIENRRAALASKIERYLDQVEPRERLVGFAFAIDGKIKAVRWFASHGIFELFHRSLVDGAALDALTARAEAQGSRREGAVATSADVVAFVESVERGAVTERRDTSAGNANEYKASPAAYGSKTLRKSSAGKPSSTISFDYLAH